MAMVRSLAVVPSCPEERRTSGPIDLVTQRDIIITVSLVYAV